MTYGRCTLFYRDFSGVGRKEVAGLTEVIVFNAADLGFIVCAGLDMFVCATVRR